MASFTVEPSGLKLGTCDTCGGPTGLIIGFGYRDGDAHAVYYVDWCESHPSEERLAYLTVGLGEWADESDDPTQRSAYGVYMTRDAMTLADRPHRDRPGFLGTFVPRDEALQQDLTDLWHLADHIALDDPNASTVVRWLTNESDSALRELERSGVAGDGPDPPAEEAIET